MPATPPVPGDAVSSVENASPQRRALAFAAGIVALDQFTKGLALAILAPEVLWKITDLVALLDTRVTPNRPIFPFFNLALITNKGAAWGMFKDTDFAPIALTALAAIASIVLALVLARPKTDLSPHQRTALAVILGGIVGNLIDRLRFGAVVDFLDIHLGGWHWPAFNVADSAICVGVFLYLLASFRADSTTEKGPEKSSVTPTTGK